MQDVWQRAAFEVAPTCLEHPILAAVHGYWTAKRGERAMPARADIDPLDLREHLGWIVLLDVLPGFTDFRYRLVGTKVAHYFGGDGTGKTISDAFSMFEPEVVQAIVDVHRWAAEGREPVRAHGKAAWLKGLGLFDSLHLPLSDDGETANMVLSAFTFDYGNMKVKSSSLLF